MLNLYPHHIFIDKVINQITHRKNKLWRFLPATKISLSGLGEMPERGLLKKKLELVLGDVKDVVSHISTKEQQIILESANLTLNHQFDYLGSAPVHMPKIRWHDDFKTGFSWTKGVYYLKQRSSTKKGADIKVPWELSRCHHLLWLGEAFLISKDEKYAKEVVEEIEDWWKENPFLYSVNWTCTMDVAIRAVNWMYAVCMVLDSSAVSDVFVDALYKSLYQHGWYIFNNLERSIPYSNNHLFSDLAGLLFLAFLFKDTKRGGKWLEYSRVALYDEIRCQILPSGAQYERSVSYHRLMTEMVASSVQLLKRQNVSVPSDIDYRMASMFSFIDAYTKPNGLAPLIEDNDDGRFLPFVKRDFRYHNYLLDESSAECLFLTAGAPPLKYDTVKKSQMFGDVGHCVLKDKDIYLFVTNGEQSSYPVAKKTLGTHTHNDKLSFELVLGGEDIIIDPGAYVYTPIPDKSNEFRSTIKHNTILVDNEEQNIIAPNNVFGVTKNSHSTLFNMLSEDSVEGEYKTFQGRLTHHRRFAIKDNSLIISDGITKAGGNHCAILSYHLSPYVEVKIDGDLVKLHTSSYSVELSFDKKSDIVVVDDTVSPSYGILEPSKTIRVSFSFDNSESISTLIKWEKRK